MQVTEVLSDLTSLYVCDHEPAIHLVSSHQPSSSQQDGSQHVQRPLMGKKHSGINTEGDVDLQRALDLSNLHSEMKEKHGKGAEMDQVLEDARRRVAMVHRQISMQS